MSTALHRWHAARASNASNGQSHGKVLPETQEYTTPRLNLYPWGIEGSDTATCYECPDGRAVPTGDDWACPLCGCMWPIEGNQ